ncbi:MAG: uracil-DNA glycosylase [Deltaproteobacteria bacterium]|nr:uracil-DNA glycosylase [Deltaproteobacteria bacterium]
MKESVKIKKIRNKLLRGCKKAFIGSKVVFGEGPCPSRIMIIGEAPGRDETRLERPFVGRAGRFFVGIIEDVLGRERKDVYISNVVKIWPRIPTKRGRTRPPTEFEKKFFLPCLYDEIAAVNPRVVVTVGKTALSALFPSGKFVPNRWVKDKRGFSLMPVYHPAYILRRQREIKELTLGLRRALYEVRKRLEGRGG